MLRLNTHAPQADDPQNDICRHLGSLNSRVYLLFAAQFPLAAAPFGGDSAGYSIAIQNLLPTILKEIEKQAGQVICSIDRCRAKLDKRIAWWKDVIGNALPCQAGLVAFPIVQSNYLQTKDIPQLVLGCAETSNSQSRLHRELV